MKAYVITTGIMFGLFTVLHVWLFFAEGVTKDPHKALLGILAGGLCFWSIWVLRRPSIPRS